MNKNQISVADKIDAFFPVVPLNVAPPEKQTGLHQVLWAMEVKITDADLDKDSSCCESLENLKRKLSRDCEDIQSCKGNEPKLFRGEIVYVDQHYYITYYTFLFLTKEEYIRDVKSLPPDDLS